MIRAATCHFKTKSAVTQVRNGNFKYRGKTRDNPFLKYLRAEDKLQHEFIKYCGLQYPWLRYHHSPNEGNRSEFERFLYNYLGSDSGFPDLIFPGILLVIELKVKPGRVSENQDVWLEYFRRIGWQASVCWSFDEARGVLDSRVKEMIRNSKN